MKLRIHHFDLPLRHVFTISRESIRVQPTVIVELEEDGHRGYGEATTNAYYRVTVRVEGPRNTVAYAQAILK